MQGVIRRCMVEKCTFWTDECYVLHGFFPLIFCSPFLVLLKARATLGQRTIIKLPISWLEKISRLETTRLANTDDYFYPTMPLGF